MATHALFEGSILRLLADLAQIGWGQKPNLASYVRLFTTLLDAQRRMHPSRDAAAHLVLVRNMVQARCRQSAYRILLKRRLDNSTYLTPVSRIIDRLNAQADVAFHPIDEALSFAYAELVDGKR